MNCFLKTAHEPSDEENSHALVLVCWLVRYLLWISVLYASVGSGLFHMAFWVGYRKVLVFELDWLYISWDWWLVIVRSYSSVDWLAYLLVQVN